MDDPPAARPRVASAALLAATALWLPLAGGCGRGLESAADLPRARPVELSAFADPGFDHGDATDADAAVLAAGGTPAPETAPARLDGAAGPAVATPGLPVPPAASDRPVVVDVLVGEVNGRPIFADDFFEPIEDRLVAIGRRTNPSEFVREASEVVGFELQQVVQNALFLAEAEADLSDQERQGLRYWLQSLAEGEKAKRGGIEKQAREKIEAEEGLSLEDYVERQRDEQLIRKLISDRILPRVIVSWRDIETEYQRRFDEFNPPPQVTLSWVRVRRSDADLVAEVQRRLDAGEDFSRIATDAGMEDGGRWNTFRIAPERLAESEELAPVVREAVAGLREPGDVSPPVETGTRVTWFELSAVERPAGRSLYDPAVQRQLRETIRGRRLAEEQVRFYRSLLDEGIYDELEGMASVLVQIAIRRYGPR